MGFTHRGFLKPGGSLVMKIYEVGRTRSSSSSSSSSGSACAGCRARAAVSVRCACTRQPARLAGLPL
jgi:hypothetical protein